MSISLVNLSSDIFGAYGQTQTPTVAQPATSDNTSSIVKLSLYGQTRASIADLQTQAHGFKTLNMPPNFGDFQLVMQGFIHSLNSYNQLSQKQSALAQDSLSSQSPSNNRLATPDAGELSSLNKMGIARQADGIYSIDQKQLGKSFMDNRSQSLSTAFNFSDRVTQSLDKGTSSMGFGGKKMNVYSFPQGDAAYGSGARSSLFDTSNQYAQPLWAQVSPRYGTALKAYMNIASL